MKIVGGRGRGPLRRDQHVGLRRGGDLAPLAGRAATSPSYAGSGRRCVGRSTGWSSLQLPFGGIAWSQEWHDGAPARVNEDALLAGSSSIYQSLRAGVALAELLDDPQPEWELAGGRLGHALREHRDLFLDKSTFSMDWYYPVLGGAVRGPAAHALLAERWDNFVEPGLGIRCVDDQPVGDRRRDLRAGDGARRHRRPRAGPASCSPTCSTCATDEAVLLDRLGLRPDERQLAARAHDLHRGGGDPGGRRARPTARRAPTSCAAPRWPRTSPRSAWSAAALPEDGSVGDRVAGGPRRTP